MSVKGPRVALVNPLAGALAHYTRTLELVLRHCGAEITVGSTPEPSLSGQSAAGWAAGYWRAARRCAPGPEGICISVWPAAGYWDLGILRSSALTSRNFLIIHDPTPLVRAFGYGRIASLSTRLLARYGGLIAHSAEAAAEVRERTGLLEVSVLPHPVMPDAAASEGIDGSAHPVIRVLGQYKQDRDVAALAALASTAPAHWTLEIVGRGWPEIPGWRVRAEFVDELAFRAAVSSASVVVIPYRRFYQSGVAIRCLESGTPFVGPDVPALRGLLGENHPWLVQDGEYLSSIKAALDGAYGSAQAHERYSGHVSESWSRWLTNISSVSP